MLQGGRNEKKAIVLLLITVLIMLNSCGRTSTPQEKPGEPSQEEPQSEEVNKKEYSTDLTLLNSDYLFFCDSYITSPTYGMLFDIGNEKIALMVFSLSDIDDSIHVTDVTEGKELLKEYIFESIKRPRGDRSDDPEALPIETEEMITTSNGIEMLKVTGKLMTEMYGEEDIVDYTVYFFTDRGSPIYAFACPMPGEKKSDIPDFDKDVDAFIQSIEKVSN